MVEEVPKIKDFYIVFCCISTTASAVECTNQTSHFVLAFLGIPCMGGTSASSVVSLLHKQCYHLNVARVYQIDVSCQFWYLTLVGTGNRFLAFSRYAETYQRF